jgi:hypothetical protein
VIPDLSVVCVIFLGLPLTAVTNRLLLRPVTRVMGEHDGAIRPAHELAEASREKAQAAREQLDRNAGASTTTIVEHMLDRKAS